METDVRKTTALNSLTLAALLAAGVSTAVLAQEPPPGPPGEPEMFLFDQMDADKDGKVTQAEVDAFKAARFAEADADKDGKLSAAELAAMREKAEAARKEAMATKMISRIDADGESMLSLEEMNAGPRPKSMIERLDTDGDGAVSKAEAEAMRDRMQDRMGKGRDGGHGGKGGHGRHGDREGGFWGWWFN